MKKQNSSNYQIGEQYYKEIRALIKKYYTSVSDYAIEQFLITGDFAELTAKQLLSKSGLYLQELEPKIEEVASKFVISLESKTDREFKQIFVEAKKPFPLKGASIKTENLIAQQVSKISNLLDYQYQRINEAMMVAVNQNMNLTNLKKALRENGIADEKRIRRIAHDQLHYASNLVDMNRASELGLTHARWYHPKSNAIYKTEPRKDHVEADGKVFKISKGCKISGEYIYPGQLPNCRCSCDYLIEDTLK